eukprot:CAMPEP_0202857022 /NCGR_PEP_ID=MMETSP1391-20130828/113_1 /ASSEMBLY_ACC=CAM_ASM_000867 /TAXON_ID=1034604 /ORGANISM="Chlamydomonas leiostraca, Strain SAG 11-49" /LENGTH=50 /DNA_ID=CAMNT_0049535767 /DNA_START=215 /DNA_END=367 /DNA_ORIENTATION=+
MARKHLSTVSGAQLRACHAGKCMCTGKEVGARGGGGHGIYGAAQQHHGAF